jgi:PKD repeat protein
MKKLYLLILMCLVGMAIIAQPVGRQKVVVEIGTGTWCPYCPGAAMGADDLVENGCQVGNIEYHYDDTFENEASLARLSYYGITGYPTAYFDGVLNYVGGSNTLSMYSNYLPLYQQRMAIPSDFTVDIYGENTGLVYNIQLVINKVNGTHGNLTVQLALTESEIVFSWQGQDHLNYVERLMAPNHLGTVVNFANQDEATLNLTFTMDAGWVTNNCELVAFIQDESTKEILQAMMVPIPDLEPMQATAGFTCEDVTPCMAFPVDFEDQSGGEIISWNWTFEGGNPATSAAQNPSVTYNNLGDYDVQLIVYDGEVYDTLLNPNYISVITNPPQPSAPSGQTVVCQDETEVQYTVPLVQWGNTYQWMVEPDDAGDISGPDPVATFYPAPNYIGNYTIKVRADNDCGNGTWSQPLNCSRYMTPTQFTLSDGAGYCEGTEGVEVTLDGSQEGVDYELYIDGDPTGQILPGTGSALDFGYQTEQGIYTCQAFTDYCSKEMVGNTYIFVISQPSKPSTPTGPNVQCSNYQNTTYTTTTTTGATSYAWSLVPSNAGTITGNTTTATVTWDADFSGVAQISVAGVNSCFTGPASNNLSVTVHEAPQPVISGDQDVCDWEPGQVYTTPMVEGNDYTWEISGGTITAGAGTNEIIVTWGNPGSGYVKVTETNEECTVTTLNFMVTIDECVGIGEEENSSFSIYPNPVSDELVISFAGKNNNSRMVIVNQLGQVVCDRMTGEEQQVIINTSGLAEGVYVLRILDEEQVTVKKFLKVK